MFRAEMMEFLLKHWLLSGGFAVLFLLFLVNELRSRALSSNQLSAQEAVQLMNHQQAVFVDLRDPLSFAKAHVVGAINIANIADNGVEQLRKYKLKPIILACANGLSSPKLAKQLTAEGFEKVYVVAGGILAWQREGLPLIAK